MFLSRQKVDPLHHFQFGAGTERLQKCCAKDLHTLAKVSDRLAVSTTSTRYSLLIQQIRAALICSVTIFVESYL